MGECSDFYIGETVRVTVPFDPPHSMTVTGKVRYVWDEFVDVGTGDTVFRFPRQAFDCSDLELGGPATVNAGDFDQHFSTNEYDPEEEASAGE